MALLNRRSRRGVKHCIKGICFMYEIHNEKKLEISMECGLPILDLEISAINMRPAPHVVYVLDEFEGNPMLKVLEKTPNIWILGPTSLEELVSDPSLTFRSQPTYCYSMYGLCFYINCPGDKPLTIRMVELIKWMGGLFVLNPDQKLTHMITTTKEAKGCKYCYTFDVPIMSPEWVEHCWQERQCVGFKAISVVHNFKLQTFKGLYIYFKGFSASDYEQMKTLAEQEGGVVVSWNAPKCTHMVVNNNVASDIHNENIPPHISYVVNDQWFFSSLELKQKDNEEHYTSFSCGLANKAQADVNSLTINDLKEDTVPSDRRTSLRRTVSLTLLSKQIIKSKISQCQDEKRKYTFKELYQTEINYINRLEELVNIQRLAIDASHPQGAILTYTKSKIIFGNLHAIIGIHKKVVEELKKTLETWTNESIIGQAFINVEDEMKKEYVIYSENINESIKTLIQCEIEDHRFRKLLETTRKDHKQHQKDLFIRPIQRLCSTSLLLHEICKHTDDTNPDKEKLNEAIKIISHTLDMMNEVRAKNEKLRLLFDIHRKIEDCPADLITSHRELIVQFSAKEVLDKCNSLGTHLKFFLFNDVFEITKVKTRYKGFFKTVGTSDSNRVTEYKHIAMLPLFSISKILCFQGKNTDMFGFHIQDLQQDKKMNINCFKYLETKLKLNDMLFLVAKQLSQINCSKSAEEFMETVPSPAHLRTVKPFYLSGNSTTANTTDVVQKAFKFVSSFKEKKVLRRVSSCSDLAELHNSFSQK